MRLRWVLVDLHVLDASDRRPQPVHHTIATAPFTLRNINQDLEDLGSRFDGAPDLEFRPATEALELKEWDAVSV